MSNEIQRAATELYQSTGADFTLAMLAERTGLSRATLYRRIGSKDRLIAALAADGLIRPDDHESTEQRVLAAARRVVGQYGFLACTMEQIAREAEIGLATLYRRFGNKEGLLQRLSAEPALRPVVRQIASNGDTDIEGELRQMIVIGLRFGAHNRDAVRAMLSASKVEGPRFEAQRQASADAFERTVAYMRVQQRSRVLRSDVTAQDLAMMLNGLVMQYALFGPAYLDRPLDLGADVDVIMALFLKAAANSTRP